MLIPTSTRARNELDAMSTIPDARSGGGTQLDSQAGGGHGRRGFHELQFSDYERLYGRWKLGHMADNEVLDIGGTELMDLMEAQKALDEGEREDTQQLLRHEPLAVAPGATEPQEQGANTLPSTTTTSSGTWMGMTTTELEGMDGQFLSIEHFDDVVSNHMESLIERALEGISTDEE